MNIQKLFEELDARHYASKISSAGFRVEMRELVGSSHTEFYGTTGFFEVGGTELGFCIFPAKLIVIDRHLGRLPFGHDRETAIRATLLHEMAHAHVESQQRTRPGGNDHGRRYLDELRRLVRAGEDCLKGHIHCLRNSPSASKLMEVP